jgi:hypothetical protein
MRSGQLVAAAVLALVGACTSPLSREGRLPPAAEVLADPSYTFAPIPGDPGSAASGAVLLVREALARKGFRESPAGHYRLEIGLASAPSDLEVQRSGSNAARANGAQNRIVLCRPRRYVLTVGMIDRTSGALLFRNAAAARHCGASLEKILPKMVHVAVTG